jgi:hypothetical protein
VKAHHDSVPLDGDVLADIPDARIDLFWSRCEEVIPEEWSLYLQGRQVDGAMIYRAVAQLQDQTLESAALPICMSEWRGMPERALEQLFYRLRDGLLSRQSPTLA